MSDNMSRFLGDVPEDEAEAAPAQAEQPQRDFEPVPEPEPEPEAPEPETEVEDVPAVTVGGRTVPLAALEAERAQRREQKDRAARLEGERDALLRQLDEIKKGVMAGLPQQPVEPPPPMDPAEAALHIRADMSKALLEDKIGEEAVAKLEADFAAEVQADPSLGAELRRQRNPYQWAQKELARRQLQKDIGSDPDAFRARIRAEIEAEMAATSTAQPDTLSALPLPRTSPAAGLQPSLARARSVAGRVTVDEGDQPLGDILGRR